ncbi:hypothetical protein UPYG_G00162280 [Umbra pygmaea]|uniref:DUF4200 domain-containing protein n=1 Tax=Umbra pygmaea TaxID=75934 RepID=A0ABD0WLV5_UMBPY
MQDIPDDTVKQTEDFLTDRTADMSIQLTDGYSERSTKSLMSADRGKQTPPAKPSKVPDDVDVIQMRNPFKMPDDLDVIQMRNPFKMPDGLNFIQIRNKEKERRKMELQRQLGLRVHEKVTYAGRVQAKQAELRSKLREGLETAQPGEDESKLIQIQNRPARRVAMIKDHNIEKESIQEFIAKKRQMFLLEYSLAAKKGEIEKLEKVAVDEEKKLARAERFLENDAILFDEFLKENDKNAVEAIKVAELETQVKMEKMAEIKKTTAKMVAIRSEISKLEDTIQEYDMYKEFLFKLSPPEWQEAQKAKALKNKSTTRDGLKGRGLDSRVSSTSQDLEGENKRSIQKRSTESKASYSGRQLPPLRDARAHSRQSTGRMEKSSTVAQLESDNSEYEEDPELYFTDPRQLLDVLSELEEQNLSLIQNSRETEEALEEFRQSLQEGRLLAQLPEDLQLSDRAMEMEQLTQQIDLMTENISRESEYAGELKIKARLFNFGKYRSDNQEGALDSLSAKVAEVYRACVGDSEANLGTLQMLAAIESHLRELLENMELIPKDKLLLAERVKGKERRVRLRDDKMEQIKKHQEDRLRKALERSQAHVKIKTGRKLMGRSQLPTKTLKTSQVCITSDKEDEQLYFFT